MQFKNFALLNSTKKPYEKRKSFSPSVYALKSYGRLKTKNSKGYFSDNKISLSNELYCDSVCTWIPSFYCIINNKNSDIDSYYVSIQIYLRIKKNFRYIF